MGLFGTSAKEEKLNENLSSVEGNAIKSVTGFSNLKDARNAAPSSTAGATPEGVKTSGTGTRGKLPSKAELEQAAKDQARAQALQAMAKRVMKKFAAGPYDLWAIMAEDERYKLSEEETQELADEYVGLANTVEVDFSKPIWLFVGVAAAHAAFIGERMKYMMEKQEAEQKRIEAENEKDHPTGKVQ